MRNMRVRGRGPGGQEALTGKVMDENFEKSVAFVLKHEGGYVNNSNDPGGETKFGISRRAYPDLDIANLTEQDAKDIYWRDYWDKAGCGELAWPTCLCVMDTAVNMGVTKAQAFLNTSYDWQDYLIHRIAYYNGINSKEFLRGWINRVIDLWNEVRLNEHPLSEG